MARNGPATDMERVGSVMRTRLGTRCRKRTGDWYLTQDHGLSSAMADRGVYVR